MRILVLTPYLPHPRSGHGGGEYVYGLVDHLSRTDDVTLVSFADKHELTLAPDLQKLPITIRLVPRGKGAQKNLLWNLYLVSVRLLQLMRSIATWQPYYVSKFRHPRMVRLIEEETARTRYDIVQIEFAQMAQYAGCAHSGKTVLREHDVMFRPSYRAYKRARNVIDKVAFWVEHCRWALYERRIVKHLDQVLTFTEPDRDLLKRLTGIDHVAYNPRGIEIPPSVRDYSLREPYSLLFVGVFSHMPNVDAALWLCEEVFPRIQQQFPQCRLYVIGKNPPPKVESLAAGNRMISMLGFVPDIEEYYSRCSVLIAPIRSGGGVRTKILHAQSFGIPVVTTPTGAEGIEGANAGTMVIARGTDGLANGVAGLFNDPAGAAQFARAGRENALRYYSWDTVVQDLRKLYERLLRPPAA